MTTKKTKPPAPKRVKSMTREEQVEEVHAFELFMLEHKSQGCVIAIDPGKKGGLAFLTNGRHLAVGIPTTTVVRNKKDRTVYDTRAICDMLVPFLHSDRLRPRVFVGVEMAQIGGYGGLGKTQAGKSAGGRPGRDTPTTAFQSAWGCAMYELWLVACGVRHEYVAPTVWKRRMGLTGKDKDASRLMAQKLFPQAELHLKDHHNRAEALLLASYMVQKHGTQLVTGPFE